MDAETRTQTPWENGARGSPGALVSSALSQARTRRLDAAQQARVHRAACDAVLHYPDDPDLQPCAVDAAIDHLHNRADLDTAAAEWQRIRLQERRLRARLRQLAVMSVADRVVSERRAARVIGVDRMLLRRWSGKRASTRAARTPLAQGAVR